jgi:hypothetical protein
VLASPPWWNDFIRYARVLVQERNIAPPRWNDVVRDVLVLVQERKLSRASFPHNRMMLFEM